MQGLGSEEIAAEIKERICSGEIKAGEKLPTTRRLCEIYGVSPNTLSRAIRRLKECGYLNARVGAGVYAANPGGATPRKKTADVLRTIAFVLRISTGRDNQASEYLSHIYDNAVLGIQDESSALGMTTGAVICPDHIMDNEEELADFIGGHSSGSDGVFFVGIIGHNSERLEQLARLPAVFVVARHAGSDTHNVFCIDEYRCACAMMRHLSGRGYKRIGCLAGAKTGLGAADLGYGMREQAWLDVQQEQKIKPDKALLFPADESEQSVIQAAEKIVSLPANKRPDAVFCFNDFRAWILLEAARKAGLCVPEDIAIAGFDGSSRALSAGITTVELPFYASGRNAAVTMNLILKKRVAPPVISSYACGIRQGKTT